MRSRWATAMVSIGSSQPSRREASSWVAPPATMSRVIAMIDMGHQTAMSRDTTINSCEKEEGVVSN